MMPDDETPHDEPNEFSTESRFPQDWQAPETVDFSDPAVEELLRMFDSPDGVRTWLEYAAKTCWLELGPAYKNLAALRREMRHLLDLMIEELHAHPEAFGVEAGPPDERLEDQLLDRTEDSGVLLLLQLALQTCGQMLPAEQRNPAEIEQETRALLDELLVRVSVDATTGFLRLE